MSVERVNLAIELMQNSGENIISTGSVSDELILNAEIRLGVKFPKDYIYFLKKYGSLFFADEMFYGLTKLGFDSESVPCIIFATESARKLGEISNKMIYIKASGYGPLFCLDLENVSEGAPVKEVPNSNKEYKDTSVIANNFGEFFYNEIKLAVQEL